MLTGLVGCLLAVLAVGDRPQAHAALDYEVRFVDFDQYRIIAPFANIEVIPGSSFAVGSVRTEQPRQRLVLVDTGTLEVTEGDEHPERIEQLLVSADGEWVDVIGESRSSGRFGRTVTRYSLPDLRFEQRYDVAPEHEIDATDPTKYQVVGGDGARILAIGQQDIDSGFDDTTASVFADGVRLPDVVVLRSSDGQLVIGSQLFVLRHPDSAFNRTNPIVEVYPISFAGVGALQTTLTGSSTDFSSSLQEFNGQLLFDGMLYPLPSLSPARTAETWMNRARVAPDLGVAFTSADGVITVRDLDTGEVLATGEDSFSGAYFGGGRFAAVGLGLLVTDVGRRVGAFGEFTPVAPARIFDSRPGEGPISRETPLGPKSTTRVQVHGLGGVPESGVSAVVLNITAVAPPNAGYVSVFPGGGTVPTVASLNFGPGQTIGNMVTVSTADGGAVDVYNEVGNTDVVVDVMGYFATSTGTPGARYRAYDSRYVTPSGTGRLLDTRQTGGRLGPQDSLVFQLPGPGDPVYTGDPALPPPTFFPPTNIVAAVMNVTTVGPTTGGHLRIFAGREPLPSASSMNFLGGTDTNRLVTSVISDSGEIEIYNEAGSTDIVVDLVGVYTLEKVAQEGRFVGIEPERLIDTREDSPFDADGRFPAGSVLTLGGFRLGYTLAANLVAVDTTRAGFMTASYWSEDPMNSNQHLTSVSSLNFGPSSSVGNHSLVSVGTGTIGIFHAVGGSHAVLDLFGYYVGPKLNEPFYDLGVEIGGGLTGSTSDIRTRPLTVGSS